MCVAEYMADPGLMPNMYPCVRSDAQGLEVGRDSLPQALVYADAGVSCPVYIAHVMFTFTLLTIKHFTHMMSSL
ncbi:hypothetical protein CC80DRAFT_210419 [Byssothecium circinans]|uniref:Uncharacterized protein n=1 Tax=Byssothecium circinans TaxID=147558 RepID=A0A6A5TI95_9PLEO|nr:hypothetical protein CC80DRAFT_210419 [Byssothecium circinans]